MKLQPLTINHVIYGIIILVMILLLTMLSNQANTIDATKAKTTEFQEHYRNSLKVITRKNDEMAHQMALTKQGEILNDIQKQIIVKLNKTVADNARKEKRAKAKLNAKIFHESNVAVGASNKSKALIEYNEKKAIALKDYNQQLNNEKFRFGKTELLVQQIAAGHITLGEAWKIRNVGGYLNNNDTNKAVAATEEKEKDIKKITQPAKLITDAIGNKFFYDKLGKLHNEGGPAVIWENGSKEWFFHDDRHRKDGPAIIRVDGSKEYWMNNKKLTKEQWEYHQS